MQGMSTITETLLTGTTIAEALETLAALRLDIFPEYPYLYRGRRDDELQYLGSVGQHRNATVLRHAVASDFESLTHLCVESPA